MDMTGAGTSVPSLTVFFPAFNEEDIIEKTVTDALAACAPVAADLEVVVVDDGSADKTPAIVERLSAADPRVRLIRHERNRGYGAALRSGFEGARKELVFFSDADGQFDLRELPGSLAMLAQAPVVVGFRIKRNDPPHRLFIAKTYKLIVRLVFGLRVRDIDCAFKLFRRNVFDGLVLESNGAFISSELLIKLSRRGIPIAERGVNHYPRTTGYSKGAGVGVILKTIKDILRLRFGMSLASGR